jgi:hypothetical protein
MPNHPSKTAILAALRREPDFSQLAVLPAVESREGRPLLRWLDQSGLALILLRQLQAYEATPQISVGWSYALGQSLAQNVARTQDIQAEFCRLITAFREQRVTIAALKGFTLVPDFCEDAGLRHQVDLDFLVDKANLPGAAAVLRSCGYSAPRLNESGETCFTTPLRHVPSPADDLYALQRHRQVDLHTSLWEESPWMPLEVPEDCLERAELHSIHGLEYLALSLEDKFLLQVFHAYRHATRSWIRLSWLLEIGRFLERHRDHAALWNRVAKRAGDARLTKSIFVFVLGLVDRIFQVPAPRRLGNWTAEAMTPPIQAWLDHFAIDWAISDWPGSLKNIFLANEFIPDRRLRSQYWKSRLFPRRSQTSLGNMANGGASALLKLQTTRLRYIAQRGFVHLKDICWFPVEQFRWKRALNASRGSI